MRVWDGRVCVRVGVSSKLTNCEIEGIKMSLVKILKFELSLESNE